MKIFLLTLIVFTMVGLMNMPFTVKANSSKTDNPVIWDFADNSQVKEWSKAKKCNIKVISSRQNLKFYLTKNPAYLYFPLSFSFPAASYRYVIIKMKAVTKQKGNYFNRIYWTTDQSKTPGDDKLITQKVNSKKINDFQFYTFDMSIHKEWKRNIVRLRLDPFNGKGSKGTIVEINKIILSNKRLN